MPFPGLGNQTMCCFGGDAWRLLFSAVVRIGPAHKSERVKYMRFVFARDEMAKLAAERRVACDRRWK